MFDATPHRPVRGFTLIEVMAALVIVSLGMLAVIQAVSQTASNGAYLRDKTLAHWVAMNRVTELRVAAQPPATGESSGEVEMGGRRWHWNTEVTPTQLPSMKRIDVSVRSADAADSSNRLANVTGFYGEKIAPAGSTPTTFDGVPQEATGSSSSSSSSSSGSNSSSGSSSGSTSSGGSGK